MIKNGSADYLSPEWVDRVDSRPGRRHRLGDTVTFSSYAGATYLSRTGELLRFDPVVAGQTPSTRVQWRLESTGSRDPTSPIDSARRLPPGQRRGSPVRYLKLKRGSDRRGRRVRRGLDHELGRLSTNGNGYDP